MAIPAPSRAVFIAKYPEFKDVTAATVDAKLAEAARRTSATLFKSTDEATDACCLRAAILVTKTPEGRQLRLVSDEQAFVWESEWYRLIRGAGMGNRVY